MRTKPNTLFYVNIIFKINLFLLLCTHYQLNKTNMTNTKKKISFYLTAIVSIALTTVFIYSCSSDDYNHIDKQKSDQKPLIESVATSDEFWNFEMASELLFEKFQSYTATLSREEYDKLLESLNNDDYMEDFIKKANLKKELRLMDEAKESLIQHTNFSKLNEEARTILFREYAESRETTKKILIKTRTEDGNNECEAKKQTSYAQAKTDYNNDIFKCRIESSTNYCYTQALAIYERNKRTANREYEECIKR